MNKIAFFALVFLALGLIFVSAQEKEDVKIEISYPETGNIVETSGSNYNVAFKFSVLYTETVNTKDNPLSCALKIQSSGVSEDLKLELNEENVGYIEAILALGSYEWKVVCSTLNGEWFSESRTLTVEAKEEEIVVVNTNSGGSGGSSKKSNDDESNGRKPLDNLNLENLSTTPSEETETKKSSMLAGITGAVIGAVGKKGAIGIVVLIIVLAIVGFLVYNRKSLGVVKAQ